MLMSRTMFTSWTDYFSKAAVSKRRSKPRQMRQKQPDGSFTVPWFLKNVVLVLAKRTFWVQKSFLKKVHRKMLSSTLPAFCGQKRAEFGFPFFSSQLCQVEARFGQQVSYLYIYKCIISIYVSICMIAISVYVYICSLQVRIYICLYVSVVQANVNMAHPTPPNPNPMRDVASTSWRKCKRTLTCPTPPNPNPMRDVASTSWRKCKRTLTCPTPPHPTPTPCLT